MAFERRPALTVPGRSSMNSKVRPSTRPCGVSEFLNVFRVLPPGSSPLPRGFPLRSYTDHLFCRSCVPLGRGGVRPHSIFAVLLPVLPCAALPGVRRGQRPVVVRRHPLGLRAIAVPVGLTSRAPAPATAAGAPGCSVLQELSALSQADQAEYFVHVHSIGIGPDPPGVGVLDRDAAAAAAVPVASQLLRG